MSSKEGARDLEGRRRLNAYYQGSAEASGSHPAHPASANAFEKDVPSRKAWIEFNPLPGSAQAGQRQAILPGILGGNIKRTGLRCGTDFRLGAIVVHWFSNGRCWVSASRPFDGP